MGEGKRLQVEEGIKMERRIIYILISGLIVLYLGCDSRGISDNGKGVVIESEASQSVSSVTVPVKMTIKWPISEGGMRKAEDVLSSQDGFLPDAESLPDATLSIRITVTGDAISSPIIAILNRTEGLTEESLNLEVPVGINSFEIEAFDAGDAGGNVIASDSIVQNIVSGGTNYLVFTLSASTMRVEVYPSTVTTSIGGVEQFSASSFNADEEIILGNNVLWSTGDNEICEVDSEGLVFARAEGECEVIARSDSVSGSATMIIRPFAVAPTEITLVPNDGAIEIRWNSVLSATSYNIYWDIVPGVTKEDGNRIAGIEDTSYIHDGVSNGMRYYYIITSINDAGEGEISEEFSGIPGNLFAYVANRGSGSIGIYDIDGKTGELTLIGDVTTKYSPFSVITDPTGRHLYIISSISNSIGIYDIDGKTGELTLIGDVINKDRPSSLVVDVTGRYLYVTNRWAGSISMYSIDSRTGGLTLLGEITTGRHPSSLGIDPIGRYLYATNMKSNTISMYSIDTKTGKLTLLGETTAADQPISIDIDPGGRYLYASNKGSDEISIYSIDRSNGRLTWIEDIIGGKYPSSLGIDPGGRYLYVTNMRSNTISMYSIDEKTGRLTLLGEVTGVNQPTSIDIDPGGRYLYVSNKGSDEISIYSIDKEDGGLNPIGTIQTGDEPSSLTIYTIAREIQVGDSIEIEVVIR